MRHVLSAFVLIGALAAPALAAPAPKATKAAAATHSTMGVVKSVDANQLVVTHHGKKHSEMKFTLDPSTTKQGDIAVGESVAVRYRNEGTSHVATAVTVRQAAKSGKPAKH